MAVVIHGIYASTSGNTELVMEKVVEVFQTYQLELQLHRAEQTPITLIQEQSYFLLGTSTWEHGVLNPFFAQLHTELQQTDCRGKSAAFIGSGDARYEPVLFCRGIDILKETWEQQGGEILGQTLKIQGEPHQQLTTTIQTWAELTAQALQAKVQS